MHGNQTIKIRLDSWKEIAAHLGRDVRTVIRWEKKGLPVHRVPGGQRKVVFAYTREIDTWLVSQEADGNAVLNGNSIPPDGKSGDAEKQISGESPVLTDSADISAGTVGETAERSRLAAAIQAIRAHKWRVSASAGVLGLALFVFFARSKTPAILHPTRLERLTDDGRYRFTLRTNGRALYFNEIEGSRSRLMSWPLSGGPARTIQTPFASVELSDISSDGNTLLVTSREGISWDKSLWTIPAGGGTPRRLGITLCSEARWSPDNLRIACVSGNTIVMLNADGSNPHTVMSFSKRPMQLIWSPDGQRLRFTLQEAGPGVPSAWELSPAREGSLTRLPLGNNCCADWAWTRDNSNFVSAQFGVDGIPAVLSVKPKRGAFSGWFSREAELPVSVGNFTALAPGKTGNSLYLLLATAYRGELLKFEARQNNFQTFLPGLSGNYLSFSRDGQWITYVDSVEESLWRSRADGSEAFRLTQSPIAVQMSSWSPDGRRIAFMGKYPGKPFRLMLVGRDGGAIEEVIPGNDQQGAPTWSPDGRALIYANVVCEETQSCWIWQVDLASRTEQKLPGSHGLRTARWSPNGKYVAALQADSRDLMLFDMHTKRWSLLADAIDGDNINWAADSQFVYVDNPHRTKPVIERICIRDGERSTVVDLSPMQKMHGETANWIGLTPRNEPIVFHLDTASELYELEWNP